VSETLAIDTAIKTVERAMKVEDEAGAKGGPVYLALQDSLEKLHTARKRAVANGSA
jgi:hypothetical protein